MASEGRCYDCDDILPANQLRRKRISQSAGSSFGVTRRGHKSGPTYDERATKYYRNRDILICSDCAARRRRNAFLKFLFWVAVIGGGFVYLTNHRSSSRTHIDAGEGAQGSENLTAKEGDATPAASEVEQSQGEGLSQPAEHLSDKESSQSDAATVSRDQAESEPTKQDATTFDFNSDRIQEVAQEALNSGSSEMWKEAGRKGYAVVSAITESNGSSCRSLFFTLIEDGSQTQSEVRKMCKTDSGQWEQK